MLFRSGNGWGPLGLGMNSNVYALAVSGTNLYAGGQFTTAGGVEANCVAQWNGSTWLALGSGIGGEGTPVVYALAVSGSDLYAAGDFTAAGGISAGCIAKWNGRYWSALGSGLSGAVYALAVNGTDLFAGGEFWYAMNAGQSPIRVNRIAKWNGSTWSALGSGMYNYSVIALALMGSDLYAGGDFLLTQGGGAGDFIAKWNGNAWSALGLRICGSYESPSVNALLASVTNLYAAVPCTTESGQPMFDILIWDGAVWSAMGWGMNREVYALALLGTDLYAGGIFKRAGNKVSALVAKAMLTLPPAGGLARTMAVSNGIPSIVFQGTPGSPYDVQRTTSLSPPVEWTTLTASSPLTPAADGLFTFTDTNAPVGTAYYRSGPR